MVGRWMFNRSRGKRCSPLHLQVNTMLRFFRTIRKKMIEEDNVRRYLLYAIGEILLVVIGILIVNRTNAQIVQTFDR